MEEVQDLEEVGVEAHLEGKKMEKLYELCRAVYGEAITDQEELERVLERDAAVAFGRHPEKLEVHTDYFSALKDFVHTNEGMQYVIRGLHAKIDDLEVKAKKLVADFSEPVTRTREPRYRTHERKKW